MERLIKDILKGAHPKLLKSFLKEHSLMIKNQMVVIVQNDYIDFVKRLANQKRGNFCRCIKPANGFFMDGLLICQRCERPIVAKLPLK